MIKCSMSRLKQLLPVYIRADKPVMIWGAPGEGKSGLVKSVTEKIGADLQDFRLLLRDVVDVHGLPKMNDTGRMSWSYPEEIPLAVDDIKNTRVMFLDELPAAATSIQTVAYQMLHERAIDNTPLHKNVRFIAAGNRERDGAVSNRMPTPLANRMAHFDVTADVDSWLEWGHQKGIYAPLLAHIENSPQDLRVADEKEYLTKKAFRSPRSWEYASDVLKEAVGKVDSFTDGDYSMVEDIVGSFVDTPTAANFIGYMRVGHKLPKPADIVSGGAKGKKFELHEQFFISCGVLAHLAEQRKKMEVLNKESPIHQDPIFSGMVDNTVQFVRDSFDAETLASFAARFINKEWYGFKMNDQSPVQKEFAKWLFSAKDGAARLVFA